MAKSEFQQVLKALILEARENGQNQADALLREQIDYLEERIEDTESLYESSLAEIGDLETQLLESWIYSDHCEKGLDLCYSHILTLHEEKTSLRQSLDSSMVHQEGLRGDIEELKALLEGNKNPPQKRKGDRNKKGK